MGLGFLRVRVWVGVRVRVRARARVRVPPRRARARVRAGVRVRVRVSYLLVVLGRYHEDVALAELRPELRALDASIELVAVDRLDE